MKDALDKLKKAHKDGYFYKYSQYPGLTYLSMETDSKGSKWNTLRALRVLRYYDEEYYHQLIEKNK